MKHADCLIIGAGISGLACGLTLLRQGLSPLILEASDSVGGRIKTTRTSHGFLLDHGFQVILNSYPELKRFADIEKLKLRKFNSGALVYTGQRTELLANPVAHPETLISSLLQEAITPKDKILVIKLIAVSQFFRSDSSSGKKSTLQFLKDFGFSDKFIEIFWRPFLSGIYLDPELSNNDEFFQFLIRCFSSGQVSVPENGMAELPNQMALQLPPGAIALDSPVASWTNDSVTLRSGEKIAAKKVICAHDPAQKKNYRQVTTYYFTSHHEFPSSWNRWLILVPRQFGLSINHFCVLTSVSSQYGNGRPLLSVSTIGEQRISIQRVIEDVQSVAQTDLELEFLEAIHVQQALPVVSETSLGIQVRDNVIYCGDYLASPSINGALRSGRLAAEQVLQDLGIRTD